MIIGFILLFLFSVLFLFPGETIAKIIHFHVIDLKMKKSALFFIFITPFFVFAQIQEDFSDGDFTTAPVWEGNTERFVVNAAGQLQSNASTASRSFLFTPSQSINNAVWECSVKINYTTSANNYASVYVVSDRADVSAEANAYYVKIGGSDDEVSLFVQQGKKQRKIIDGTNKRTEGNPVMLRVKLIRDDAGNFELYSKLATEDSFVLEGKVQDETFKRSSYFGLSFSNTAASGKSYFFDDIAVSGESFVDNEAPVWEALSVEAPNRLRLRFSEAVNVDKAVFELNDGLGQAVSKVPEGDFELLLEFERQFQPGTLYTLYITGLTDLSGNELLDGKKLFGIPQELEAGDLRINEILFEAPEASVEYIELVNASNKLLDISNFLLALRKKDKSLQSGVKIPSGCYILPGACVAFCSDAERLRNYYRLSGEEAVLTTETWQSLPNQEATVVLTNSDKSLVCDELTYNAKWHNPLFINTVGIALERIHPALATQDPASWHSAASEVNYGTPGYRNSQYVDITSSPQNEKRLWLEPEAFSPDNDGVDDLCRIRYKLEEAGYTANVFIFNALGNVVCRLAENVLLRSEGVLLWDGRTEQGRNADSGVYVVFFQAFNLSNGKRLDIKLPLVLSMR